MLVSTDTATAQEELEAYHLAYMHIFRNIVAKKGLPAERQKQILLKIKSFQETKIRDVDSYLDHIPDFANVLAVKPDQLGAFIGSNLLKALHQVQAQQAQKKKLAAQATKVVNDPEVKKSILKEIILTIGPVIEPPGKFTSIDMGLMSLELNGTRVNPVSLKNDPASLGVTTVTGKQADDSGAAASTKETPLLEEFLQVLGADHAILERLVVPAFPKDMMAPELSVASAQPATDSSGDRSKERSILQEIVDSFGNDLTVSEKLVVPAFPAGQSAQPTLDTPTATIPTGGSGIEGGSILTEIIKLPEFSGGSSEKLVVKSSIPGAGGLLPGNDQATEDAASAALPDWEPIEFTYGDYDLAIRKVQNFQAKKDGAGYKAWLEADSTDRIKLMLALRKLDSGILQGKTVNLDDEHYNLSRNFDLHLDQVKEFHGRLKTMMRLQKLVAMFISKVKAQPKPILAGFQKIWPQVKLILNDQGTVESRMHQLKIPMLQIMDPQIKKAVMNMMQKLFTKFTEIEGS